MVVSKTTIRFNFKKLATAKATSIWNPQIGNIPKNNPNPTEAAILPGSDLPRFISVLNELMIFRGEIDLIIFLGKKNSLIAKNRSFVFGLLTSVFSPFKIQHSKSNISSIRSSHPPFSASFWHVSNPGRQLFLFSCVCMEMEKLLHKYMRQCCPNIHQTKVVLALLQKF